jgi:predicted amidohydrolase
MSRIVTVGAAQLGPVARSDARTAVVERMLALLREAHAMACDLVVYPELALTTFFPRWLIEDEAELDAFFETEMPGPATCRLFEEAARLGVGFCLGYAERIEENGVVRRYNTSILVDRRGQIVLRYRKVHLPGHAEPLPGHPFQHLEKRFFEPGRRFDVTRAFGGVFGLAICNDRRWSETYRVLALEGVEMILIGYNTTLDCPAAPEREPLVAFHSQLVMQAGAYQNGTWVVGVAKAGTEEGFDQLADSCIIAPSGEIVAESGTTGDELVVACCDLDLCNPYKRTMFDFAAHRQIHAYRLITERVGAVPPAEEAD